MIGPARSLEDSARVPREEGLFGDDENSTGWITYRCAWDTAQGADIRGSGRGLDIAIAKKSEKNSLVLRLRVNIRGKSSRHPDLRTDKILSPVENLVRAGDALKLPSIRITLGL